MKRVFIVILLISFIASCQDADPPVVTKKEGKLIVTNLPEGLKCFEIIIITEEDGEQKTEVTEIKDQKAEISIDLKKKDVMSIVAIIIRIKPECIEDGAGTWVFTNPFEIKDKESKEIPWNERVEFTGKIICIFRDTGSTYNGKDYTDFTKVGSFLFEQLAGSNSSPITELGLAFGSWPTSPPPNDKREGIFMKTEVRVVADVDCRITGVSREITKVFADNSNATATTGPDNPQAHNINKVSDHYWVVTDGPGIATTPNDLPFTNKTYHKSFTFRATGKCGTTDVTGSTDYTLFFGTDATGKIVRKQ